MQNYHTALKTSSLIQRSFFFIRQDRFSLSNVLSDGLLKHTRSRGEEIVT